MPSPDDKKFALNTYDREGVSRKVDGRGPEFLFIFLLFIELSAIRTQLLLPAF